MKKKFIALLVLLSLFVQSFFMMPVQAEEDANWTRISGTNRYETCVRTADTLRSLNNYNNFNYAVLASGQNFADALGGSYLACLKDAPIFVTNDKNAEYINQNIKWLVNQGATIYVLGGTAAVSEAAVADLQKDYKVVRLKGSNRYGTNIEILKEAGVTNEEIIVATGNNFADSLSASAAGKPILLVGKALNAAQKEYLSSINTSKFYIVGGEGAVSASIEEELKAYGEVERVKGSNRFATSIEIAKKFVPDAAQAVVAYSHNFPDGLCGGPLAYKMGAPILLTRTGSEQATADYTQSSGLYFGRVLGGSSLISDDAANTMFPYNRAYAVLQDNGDFVYFRSKNTYSAGADQTVTDIMGNTYTGNVVPINEVRRIYDDSYNRWYDENKYDIYRVYVADGQKVAPASLDFRDAKYLESFDSTGMNTSNISGLGWVFSGCVSLKTADLSRYDTRNVSYMEGMFYDCRMLEELDLSSFDTSNVTCMSQMFNGCSSLKKLNVGSFDTSKTTEMQAMFSSCSSLEELDLSSFDTSNVKNMLSMFDGCSSLTKLDLSSFDTSRVTDMSGMFRKCSSLKVIDLSPLDTSKVINMRSMFSECSSLTQLDLSPLNTSKNQDFHGMFYKCTALEGLDLSGFDTSKATATSSMFWGCSSLKELDLSSFDTSKVTEMYCMFYECSSLKELDLSSFDTPLVTDIDDMFLGCKELRRLDIGRFDTSMLSEKPSGLFGECDKLESITLSPKFTSWKGQYDWDTRNKLPSGYWTNGNMIKTADELYENYASNAEEWAGTWEKAHNWSLKRWDWSPDQKAAATFECSYCKNHTESVIADLTVEERDEKTYVVAKVTGPDGKEYTDEKEQQNAEITTLELDAVYDSREDGLYYSFVPEETAQYYFICNVEMSADNTYTYYLEDEFGRVLMEDYNDTIDTRTYTLEQGKKYFYVVRLNQDEAYVNVKLIKYAD